MTSISEGLTKVRVEIVRRDTMFGNSTLSQLDRHRCLLTTLDGCKESRQDPYCVHHQWHGWMSTNHLHALHTTSASGRSRQHSHGIAARGAWQLLFLDVEHPWRSYRSF